MLFTLRCHGNEYDDLHVIVHFRNRRKEISSEIPAHEIYRNVNLFLQPVKLLEISLMMRNWNYLKPNVAMTLKTKLNIHVCIHAVGAIRENT